MSELVGTLRGLDTAKNTSLRPPCLTKPSLAVPNSRPFNPAGAGALPQTVQVVDEFHNAAAHVRISRGGYRTVQRILNINLNDNAVTNIRLPNNVGPGTLEVSTIAGASATGYLNILDDNDRTAVKPLLSGSVFNIPPNTHRLVIQGVTCIATDYAIISYPMEVYMANIVFDSMPLVDTIISFGDYVNFKVCDTGDSDSVELPYTAVELPGDTSIASFCDALVTAFNETYVAEIEPAGSQAAFHWATKLSEDDMVSYLDTSSGWVLADDNGVQFNSVDPAMIRNVYCTSDVGICQVSKFV